MTRRNLLSRAGAFTLARLALAARKRIAIVTTVYRKDSHADVIAGRLLSGYEYNGEVRKPQVDVVSMYTDQVPANDMSRGLAAQYGFHIYPTVRDALTLGGKDLAVDGVVFIGEHGNYPFNEKGQHLYPRYELYKQIMDVFRESGCSVPVYCDKFFSYDWQKAKWMYDQSHELKFPLMAGSSVPVSWRRPQLELDLGSRIDHAVMLGYGGKEVYGFHALEGLESMVERRHGFETGMAAVECIEGPAVWKWNDANPWAETLMQEAGRRCEDSKPGSTRDLVKKPMVFILDYKSGLRCAVYMLDGQIDKFAFAASVSGKTLSTEMWLQPAAYYNHFSGLTYYIEQLLVTAKPPYPVERTLLTTGTIDALMDSCYDHKKIETPWLNISYTPVKASQYSRGPVPKPV
jgi:hypothetical protein